jgi:hypothetical protein
MWYSRGSRPRGRRLLLTAALTAVLLTGCTSTPAANPRAGSHPKKLAPSTPSAVTDLTRLPVSTTPGKGPNALIAVGLTEYQNRDGAVDVFFPDGGRQRITPASLGLPPSLPRESRNPFHMEYPSYFFGSSLAEADLNGDGLTDLVVGAKGEGLEEQYEQPPNPDPSFFTPVYDNPPASVSGRVWILLNSAQGFGRAGLIRVPIPAHVGDLAGASLALSRRASGDGVDLWVGAPGLWPKSQAYQGMIYRFVIDEHAVPKLLDRITTQNPLIPRSAVTYSGPLGLVLAGAHNGVVVGQPGYGTDPHTSGAGEIIRLRTDRTTNELIDADAFWMDSPGVPSNPGHNDHFGATISQEGLAVGIPGDDVATDDGRTVHDAGSVQLFSPSPTRPDSLVPGPSLHQGSPGVPGRMKKWFHFGSDVAVGNFICPGVLTLAVGSPELVGPPRVTMVSLPGTGKTCAPLVLSEKSNGSDLNTTGGRLVVLGADAASAPATDHLLIGDVDSGLAAVWGGSPGASVTFGPASPDGDFGDTELFGRVLAAGLPPVSPPAPLPFPDPDVGR